ncbi:Right handed beta helix region [Seinonella peptonophila]|uniref:Right handed beta helix region n=1 Tax=Seinonella peptonophila TaxID=112248 RepID=A0A1M4X6E5_9BACL|nr:right-handed parallel beta-helix repeat-containing protein [Seinonella peptonophila]SHE89084.1 Right handed beta helix region [Seinonella peptonophila]
MSRESFYPSWSKLKSSIDQIKKRRTYLSDFPALPGERDDCGRFQRAIAKTPVGGELVVPDGYYFADSLTIHKNISVIFQGNATIEATAPNRDILRIEGSRDQRNYILSKPLKRGDREILLSTTPSFQEGDVIILTDDTRRNADQQMDMNTEIHEIEAVVNQNQNLVRNAAMVLDSDRDGVVDQFSSYSNHPLSEIFQASKELQAQVIQLPRVAVPTRAGIVQSIPLQQDQVYTFQVETKVAEASGDFEGSCYLVWYDRASKIIGREYVSDFTPFNWSTIRLHNIKPPAGSAFCKIFLEVETETPGSYGTIYFRNLKFQSASTRLILRDFVRLPKQISTKGVNIYRIHPLNNIKVKNFKYRLKEGSESGNGLTLQYIRGGMIEEIQGDRGAGSGVQILKSMHITVRDFRFLKPQHTGSGQGYGVQCYGGCSHILIQNGYTLDCRHSVDLDSTFDATIEHVFDYNSQGAAFVMSHNGCCSDITFRGCQTLHSIGSGFVADSQGFADRRKCTFHNFRVIDCTAVIQNPTTAAIYWYSPCKNAVVRDCTLRYDGVKLPAVWCNAGIRIYPVESDVTITGCDITGFRRGVALQVGGKVQLVNEDDCAITVRDSRIKNCQSAFLCYQGKERRVSLYNIDCQSIHSFLLELSGTGSFKEFVIDGLSVQKSPKCQFTNQPKQIYTVGNQGYINNIRSDRTARFRAEKNWRISQDQLFLNGNSSSLLLEGSGFPSASDPIPDGWVEGQQLTLVTTQGEWVIKQGANMLLSHSGPELILNERRRTLTLIWQSGKWVERS